MLVVPPLNVMYRGVLLQTVERQGDSIIIKNSKGIVVSSREIGSSLKQ